MNRDEKRQDIHSDLKCVQLALSGDSQSRKELNSSIDPIIRFNTQRFCKRFCQQNYLRFRCSLPERPLSSSMDLALCEWGNGSYGWMLDELVSEKRLSSYRAENSASFYQYCYQIANSIAFFERWKNWRFGRRIHVPVYINELDEKAAAVFMALQKSDDIAMIAQSQGFEISQVKTLVQKIIIELTKRKKLYLLDTPTVTSLSGNDEDEQEIATEDNTVIFRDQVERLTDAWHQLDDVEQFVIETMMLEQQDANTVLAALQDQARETSDTHLMKINDRQSLYYFRRKSFEKLSKLANGNSNEK